MSNENRIDRTFRLARERNARVFIPFLTAGDPDLATTASLLRAIAKRAQAASVPLLFELGFPYTDPIADGATIQSSYTRALAAGVRVAKILAMVRAVRVDLPDLPLVAMVSCSLVHRAGFEKFLDDAKEAGLDGAIVPDLPLEEAASLHEMARARDLRVIQLIAPTTTEDRRRRIAKMSTGFVYYVSVAGITGERTTLPGDLVDRLVDLKRISPVPVAVGFGISRPEQVRELSQVADGIIVGSAIVRQLGDLRRGDEAGIERLADAVANLFAPLAPSTSHASVASASEGSA